MTKPNGFKAYKNHWEAHAASLDTPAWDTQTILILTISKEFKNNLEQLQFSNHSFTQEDEKFTLRLKVPYNYYKLDNFILKAIELLGIEENCLLNFSLNKSKCTFNSIKKK